MQTELESTKFELAVYKAGEYECFETRRQAYFQSTEFGLKFGQRTIRMLTHGVEGAITPLREVKYLPSELAQRFVNR